MKSHGSIVEQPFKLPGLSVTGDDGILGVRVKSVDIGKNTNAKAIIWVTTDAELRKLGEQTELDTLVVLAVNDEY